MPGKEENDTLEKSLKELNLTSDVRYIALRL